MSASKPLEFQYLAPAEAALNGSVLEIGKLPNFELRIQILEAASSRFGGFDLAKFHKVFGVESKLPSSKLLELAAPVASAIESSPIPPALALSALARETLDEQDRKNTGAYHTDFRLAQRLAQLAAPKLTHNSKVIDPACGAGILLAALTNEVCGVDRTKAAHWLSQCVCAADLSANSLRASLLSLASFTDSIPALQTMRERWFCGDSLMADRSVWAAMAPNGFDAVIGNPPWEKVKLSKHEFLKSSGAKRHYGSQVDGLDEKRFASQRNEIASYSKRLLNRYPNLGSGEPDLYVAFTDLFFDICREGGVVSALVPGGLIRSQGTQVMREKIFNASQQVTLSVIDNRARFFAIDSRFKFLAITLVKTSSGENQSEPIHLLHERGTPTGVETTGRAAIDKTVLSTVRHDLSLPEVRSVAEWDLFAKIANHGVPWNVPGSKWTPKFCREVDMTKERKKFLSEEAPGSLPLVEGRMVHSHRFGVKGHVSGTGRSAKWEPYAIGASKLSPQFWIQPDSIPRANQHRVDMPRIGFCDIAGQTNERALMATVIPAGVVCGNKVPTITFPTDPSEERLLVWVAIANSFVFDWMLRRVLTTTVNYFLLQSIPLPRLAEDGLPWKKLVNAAQELRSLDCAGATPKTYRRMAQLRAEIDAEVAVAYGLDLEDMELVLHDFPILDRGQIPLPKERQSTVTRDTALAAMEKRTASCSNAFKLRSDQALSCGAMAYVPSEISKLSIEVEDKGINSHDDWNEARSSHPL